jgi:hypothetical protein
MEKQPEPVVIRALIKSFLQYLRNKSYKESTIGNYKRVLYNIDVYMKHLCLKQYEAGIGKSFYYDYLEHHKINKARKNLLRTIIGRLNDFISGKKFSVQREYLEYETVPSSMEKVLTLYSVHCKGICNRENTIRQKTRHVRTFLINCYCPDIK